MRELTASFVYLVADDSPVVAGLVTEMLIEAGVAVVGPARDGLEALRLFRNTRPHGAVLDFDMPHATGLEVLRAIRAEAGGGRCLVIILTSHTDLSIAEACREAGADHFLHKSTDFAQVQDIVSAHLAAVAAGRQYPDSGSAT